MMFWLGEVAAGAMFALLFGAAAVPYRHLAKLGRKVPRAFILLFVVVVLGPMLASLPYARVPVTTPIDGFLGDPPFLDWRLVSNTLSYDRIRKAWPHGIPYVTGVFREEGDGVRERLLLDDVTEPLDIAGVSFLFAETLVSTTRRERRLDLAEFLFSFVDLKLEYRRDTGSFAISRRFLGPLSFPTVHVHHRPDEDFHPESLEVVRVYRVPWGIGEEDYRYRPRELEWFSSPGKVLLAEYRRAGGTRIQETFFVGSHRTFPPLRAEPVPPAGGS